MGRAFDKAVRALSDKSKADENTRRNLACCIIRLFDKGENNPLGLCMMALATVTTTANEPKHVRRRSLNPIGVLIPSGTDGQPMAA
jgi:hypothetical protein